MIRGGGYFVARPGGAPSHGPGSGRIRAGDRGGVQNLHPGRWPHGHFGRSARFTTTSWRRAGRRRTDGPVGRRSSSSASLDRRAGRRAAGGASPARGCLTVLGNRRLHQTWKRLRQRTDSAAARKPRRRRGRVGLGSGGLRRIRHRLDRHARRIQRHRRCDRRVDARRPYRICGRPAVGTESIGADRITPSAICRGGLRRAE